MKNELFKKVYSVLAPVLLYFYCGVAMASINIVGVEQDPIKENIALLINSKYEQCISVSDNLRTLEKDLKNLVTKATEPFGYYSPSVTLNKHSDISDCINPVIQVSLGEPVIIQSLAIKVIGDGADEKPFKAVLEQFPLTIGSTLVDRHYSDLKSQLELQASEYGYLDASFKESELLISKVNKTADITLTYDTGKRFSISKIDIQHPNDFLSKNFLLSLISLKKGDYFTRSQLYKLRKRLSGTSYFSKVNIRISKSKDLDGQAVIKVLFTPKDKEEYTAGLGFSTDTEARVRFDYKNNWLNASGYQFFAKSSFSNITKELSTGINIPSSSDPNNEYFSIDAGIKDERTDFTESKSAKLGLSHSINHDNGWKSIRFIDAVYDRFELDSNKDNSLIVAPGISWNYLETNDVVMPDSGFHFQAEIKGATKAIFSDAEFLQLAAKYKGITTVIPNHRIIYRLNLGTTYTNDLESLPIDYRYYAGGDNSVRGFSYRSISPQNSNGDFIGAKNLITASLEYDYRFSKQWAVAAFSDTGTAFNDSPDFKTSVGIGLRWLSPLGPIRLDIAKPISESDDSIRVHIRLGPDL